MKPIILCALLLAGCASSPNTSPGTEVQDSQFDARITYLGPVVRNLGQTWRLRAWRDKATQEVRAQLYVTLTHTGSSWRRYRTASLEDATQVQTVRIDTDVTCRRGLCMYVETVGVPLEPSRLDPSAGLRVRLNAQTGGLAIIEVPASYVQSFLQAMHQK